MGNKSSAESQAPKRRTHSGDGAFVVEKEGGAGAGGGGAWGKNASTSSVLCVLDTLFHVPCLYEALISGEMEDRTSISETDRNAILELKSLFEKRGRATSGSTLVAVDKFLSYIVHKHGNSGGGGGAGGDEELDPTRVYDIVSKLITKTLPDLKQLFFDLGAPQDEVSEGEEAHKSNALRGISVTGGNLESLLQVRNSKQAYKRVVDRADVASLCPVFVVTTSNSSELSFSETIRPHGQSSAEYKLQTITYESSSPSDKSKKVLKTVHRYDDSWFDGGGAGSPIDASFIAALGEPSASNTRCRLLVYTQDKLTAFGTSPPPLAASDASSTPSTIFPVDGGADEFFNDTSAPMDQDIMPDKEESEEEYDSEEDFDEDDDVRFYTALLPHTHTHTTHNIHTQNIHIYRHAHTNTHTHTHTCTNINTHTHTHTFTRINTYTHINTHTTRTHTHKPTHTHTHTHTHTNHIG